MKCVVTGGAGFIGSNLVDKLIEKNHDVVVYDNLKTGKMEFLSDAKKSNKFTFVLGDLNDLDNLKNTFSGADIIFHLAANADVRYGLEKTDRDLVENTIGTYNVLESMRLTEVKKIVFSSTSSIYGEAEIIPTPENAPFPIQTSLYASSKLSGEALITSFCEGFDFQCWIYRFVSILGKRYTHGHVYDFVNQLIHDPNKLTVLGDGFQNKAYINVQDCVEGILHGIEKSKDKINIFNLGSEQSCEVRESIGWICNEMNINPNLMFSGGRQGWIGDNPIIKLDPQKMEKIGWKASVSLETSVRETVSWLLKNQWCLEKKQD